MVNIMTPADVVFRLIGPPEVVGQILGQHKKAPYKWRHPSPRRRAGDITNAEWMRRLLDHARAHDIPLTPQHLIYGAETDEIEALVAGMTAGHDEVAA